MSIIGRLLKLLTGDPELAADGGAPRFDLQPRPRAAAEEPPTTPPPPLPRKSDFESAREAAALPIKPLKPLVLVVDDEEDIRTMLVDFVESLGLRATSASDGWQAVVQSEGMKLALIITDIQMPGQNAGGLHAYRALRQSPHVRKDLPIIFVTGMPPAIIRPQIPDDPLVRIVFKPINMLMLSQAIGELTGLLPE